MDGCRAPGLVLPAWARGGLREGIEARPHVRRLGGQACPRLRAWPLTAVLLLLLLRYPERLHHLPVRELARPGHGRQGLDRGDEGRVRDRWRLDLAAMHGHGGAEGDKAFSAWPAIGLWSGWVLLFRARQGGVLASLEGRAGKLHSPPPSRTAAFDSKTQK